MKRFSFVFGIYCSWSIFVNAQVGRSLLEAEQERSVARGLLLKDVCECWRMPTWEVQNKEASVVKIAEETKPTLQQRIKRIILPKFVMNNLPLSQVLKVLTEVVRVYDLESKEGINFVLIDPQHKAPNVDLDLQSISLEKVVHFLKEQTNLDISFVENTIVFKDTSDVGKLDRV